MRLDPPLPRKTTSRPTPVRLPLHPACKPPSKRRARHSRPKNTEPATPVAPALEWVADEAAGFLYCNAQLLEWFGARYVHLCVHGWIDKIHPADAETVVRSMLETFATDYAEYSITCRLLHNSGAWRWVLMVTRPFGAGRHCGVICDLSDNV